MTPALACLPESAAGAKLSHRNGKRKSQTNKTRRCACSALLAASPADLQMVLGPGVPRRAGSNQQAHVQHKCLLTVATVGQDARQQQRQHCQVANPLCLRVGAVHCPESLHMGTDTPTGGCGVRQMYDIQKWAGCGAFCPCFEGLHVQRRCVWSLSSILECM